MCWSSCFKDFWSPKYNTPHVFRLASYSTKLMISFETYLDNVSSEPFGPYIRHPFQ